MGEFDAAIAEFLIESDENLSQVEQDLLDLEAHASQEETLASIFRAIHTIKGTCSFLGYTKLERVAHTGETLLSLLRDGELPVTPDMTSGLLAMVDAIRQILKNIENDDQEGEHSFDHLIERLTLLQTEGSAPQEAPSSESGEPLTEAHIGAPDFSPLEGSIPDEDIEEATESSGMEEDKGQGTGKEPGDTRGSGVTDSTIRVDVRLLDKLMNMVGELVLTRNQILQWTTAQENQGLLASSQRLSLITSELQEGIMKTRMQPIGNIFSKFPRVVRDLAMTCGKSIRMDMEGQDTELDKSLLEAIKDPLTHLVRNSVDHGLEDPAVRTANGKPEEGRLLLRAYHEGGQVNIEITDDGGGINSQKVKETAIKRGVITAEQATHMTERELQGLIFLPGFSTAEKVTNVSGRGVGMDVVKTNIEKIGGAIDLHSVLGEGTTIKVKVPLTLAIIPALVVRSGGQRFAIPQVSLLELVRLEGEHIAAAIEEVHGATVCRLRGQLLPIVYLNSILGLREGTEGREALPKSDEIVNIVVLQADGQRFGLVVEDINDTEEIVVKPLGNQLKGLSVYAGATIMGDGKVALILDVLNLASHTGLIESQGERTNLEDGEATTEMNDRKETLLLVQVGETGRLAIPLSMVARLEEIPASSLESAGDQDVIQYRESILPLIQLGHILGRAGRKYPQDEDCLQLVVLSQGSRQIGLIVDRIIDIVKEELVGQTQVNQPGILCSAVVQHQVTDVLKVSTVFEHCSLVSEDELTLQVAGG